MKLGLAGLLRFLHIFIVAFMILGWLAPWPWLLKVHLIFIPLVVLMWQMADGCFLTHWEHRLRRIDSSIPTEEDGFVKSLLRLVFRKIPTDRQIKILIYVVTWGSWAVSLTRVLSAP